MKWSERTKKAIGVVIVFVVGVSVLMAWAIITTPKVTGTHTIIVNKKYTDSMMVSLGDAVTFRTVHFVVSDNGVTYRMFKKDYEQINIGDKVQITSLSDRTNVLVKIF